MISPVLSPAISPGIALSWVLFCTWSIWLLAVQGYAAGVWTGASWIPDLGLVYVLAVQARLRRGDLLVAVLLGAYCRAALSLDPPLAILAGYLGAAGLATSVRSMLAVEDRFLLALVVGLAVLGFGAWMRVAVGLRGEGPIGARDPGAWLWLCLGGWRVGISSALCALTLGPVLAGLPGLTPLRRRRSWASAGSRR